MPQPDTTLLGEDAAGDWERVMAEALDDMQITLPCGCTIELDGRCVHGTDSPLLGLGMI